MSRIMKVILATGLLSSVCAFAQSHLNANYSNISTRGARWDDGVVYFRIQPSHFTQSEINEIYEGMKTIEKAQPNIIFVEDKKGYISNDYINIQKSYSCDSYIGKRGGRQDLNLSNRCAGMRGAIIHELMHALGFEHEHSRIDRDDYINVSGSYHSYTDKSGNPHGSYDYNSIMHYGTSQCHPAYGCTQFTNKNGGYLSFNTSLSEGDIAGLRKAYGGFTPRQTIIACSGSYHLVSNNKNFYLSKYSVSASAKGNCSGGKFSYRSGSESALKIIANDQLRFSADRVILTDVHLTGDSYYFDGEPVF